MLFGPFAVFLVTLPFSGKLRPWLRWTYLLAGSFVVICGPAISLYFLMYSGDQGGIAAFFMQAFVIAVYVVLWAVTVVVELGLRLVSDSSPVSFPRRDASKRMR
jgi:hypothetical protein